MSAEVTAVGVTAVVLCGGTGRRFGGDKTQALIDGVPVLDHVVGQLPPSWPVVCVGPARPTVAPVTWVREEPPGGGPVAALAAGLAEVSSPVVVVLGGDMPYAAPAATAVVAALLADPAVDAVVGRDPQGRTQPLLAAYRTEALRRAVPDPSAGVALMRVVDALVHAGLPTDSRAALDIDTREDLQTARHRVEG
jgi:molybdopterin-guanine dinucleotide biosynthesis protein A